MDERQKLVKVQTQAAVTAAWLASGRLLHQFGLALSLVALAGAFWGGLAPLARLLLLVTLILGVVETAYALRVAFDQRLFAAWAAQAGFRPEDELVIFDEVLTQMQLRRPAASFRNFEQRIAGACGLLRKQASCLLLQFLTVLFVALGMLLNLYA